MSDCRFGVSPVNYPDPDRLIVYFRRVSDVKISEENSECLIGKSHFDLI